MSNNNTDINIERARAGILARARMRSRRRNGRVIREEDLSQIVQCIELMLLLPPPLTTTRNNDET